MTSCRGWLNIERKVCVKKEMQGNTHTEKEHRSTVMTGYLCLNIPKKHSKQRIWFLLSPGMKHRSITRSTSWSCLSFVHRRLGLDGAKVLATALVSSRLNSSLLYGITEIDLSRFQSVYTINWPAWWQSLLHLLAASHCFIPFIGCQ